MQIEKGFIEQQFNEKVISIGAVSGGDTSRAFRVESSHNLYFVKINSVATAYNMFLQESKGLQALANCGGINVPQVIACKESGGLAVLILNYIEPGQITRQAHRSLGEKLAQLHKCKHSQFGFNDDNYIGALLQQNKYQKNWSDFYIQQRLMPQLTLAIEKGLLAQNEVPRIERLYNVLEPLFKDVSPVLLHGDLWSGNYLIDNNDNPFLIDPAVYFGHSEVDIAMTELFGGFSDAFYEAYYERLPRQYGYNERKDVYQLYYLLVYLNLFGRVYKQAVTNIINKYFG